MTVLTVTLQRNGFARNDSGFPAIIPVHTGGGDGDDVG